MTANLTSIPAGSELLPSGMQSLAIILAVFHDVLAVVALILCVKLFCRHHEIGWLFISPIFLGPLYMLIVHVLRGEPLIYFKSQTLQAGELNVHYNFDFPVFYILSVIGLFMLARRKGDGKSTDTKPDGSSL